MTDDASTASTRHELDLAAIQARARAAHEHVVALCNGARWTMHIPAQPGRDSDLVIDAALSDVPALVARCRELETERDNLQDGVRSLLRTIDKLADEANAHEGEIGDMRAQLSAAEAEQDRLRDEAAVLAKKLGISGDALSEARSHWTRLAREVDRLRDELTREATDAARDRQGTAEPDPSCMMRGAYGEPICVRTIDQQRICEGCPNRQERS